MRTGVLILAVAVAVAACASDPTTGADAGGAQGVPDGGADAGGPGDAAGPDGADGGGAQPDTALQDAALDAGAPDAGPPDASPPDAATDASDDADTPPSDATATTDATATDADTAGDADAGDPWEGLAPGAPLPAVASCAPTADPCAAAPIADTALRASYRKDAYLPDEAYDEYTDPPIHGGRLHVAGIAAASGDVTSVAIGGQPVGDLLAAQAIEWFHVWPDPAVAGEPLWVAFHSRSPAWDTASEGQLTVETTGGTALDGPFPVAVADTPLTYVTTTVDRDALLVHVTNAAAEPRTIARVLVNGRDVTAAGIACLAQPTLAPGEEALVEVPLCAPLPLGSAYTVVVEPEGSPPAVGVGRIVPPRFPVEAWPRSSDCVVPTGDAEHYAMHREAGFDTMYYYWGGGAKCGTSTATLVNEVLPAQDDDFRLLLGDDFPLDPEGAAGLQDTSKVAGFLTGDESDGQLYDEDGYPKAQMKAEKAAKLWRLFPEVPVYNGAMTNGHIGTFAGMADIQGIDFYVAACAPHIVEWGTHPPLRGSYDYLRNARDNHMPLPTWLYAQGLHDGWNKTKLLTEEPITVQPDPQEILVQALSVMAAGGKGLMWFQTSMDEAKAAPERWQAIADANRLFRAVRRHLTEGDLTGGADAGPLALAEAIRSRDAVVVPLINLKVEQEMTDGACLGAAFDQEFVPHWVLGAHAPTVAVAIPADLAATDAFEVTPSGVVDVPWGSDAAARTVAIPEAALSNDVPVRLFVVAATAGVRAEIEASFGP